LNLSERLFALLALSVVISLIVWLNLPALLWPAFILTLVLLSAHRWRRERRRRGPVQK